MEAGGGIIVGGVSESTHVRGHKKGTFVCLDAL